MEYSTRNNTLCLANKTLQNQKSYATFLAEPQARFVFSKN